MISILAFDQCKKREDAYTSSRFLQSCSLSQPAMDDALKFMIKNFTASLIFLHLRLFLSCRAPFSILRRVARQRPRCPVRLQIARRRRVRLLRACPRRPRPDHQRRLSNHRQFSRPARQRHDEHRLHRPRHVPATHRRQQFRKSSTPPRLSHCTPILVRR